MLNTMFGSHTDSTMFMLPLTANVVERVRNSIYTKLRTSPKPMFTPIPPRVLRDESDTPMSVKMKAANGEACRLRSSISKSSSVTEGLSRIETALPFAMRELSIENKRDYSSTTSSPLALAISAVHMGILPSISSATV